MIQSIVNFEQLTKYKLTTFIDDSAEFLKTGFPTIAEFFNGTIDVVDSKILNEHKKLLKEADVVIQVFKSNAQKLETAEYWFLLEFVEDIRTKLQTCSKLSKILRSSRVDFSFSTGFAHPYLLGDGQTLENVSNDVLRDADSENDWTKIAMSNDLMEADWNVNEGKQLTLYYEKFQRDIVTSFVDNLVGEKIYGKDIDRKITFEYDDLKVLSYKDTVYQCVSIMSNLKQGDIPEYPSLGVNSSLYVGSNIANLQYAAIIRELTRVFSTDDLFINFNVTEIKLVEDSYYVKFEVGTKYQLVIEQSAVL